MLQDHDARGDELLADRGEAKLGLRRVRHIVFDVCQTVAFFEQRFAVLGDEHAAAELADLQPGLHVGIRLGGNFLDVGGRLGRARGNNKRQNRQRNKNAFHVS